jgi:hypothetical protein
MFYCEKKFQEVCFFLNMGILPQIRAKQRLFSEVKKCYEVRNFWKLRNENLVVLMDSATTNAGLQTLSQHIIGKLNLVY